MFLKPWIIGEGRKMLAQKKIHSLNDIKLDGVMQNKNEIGKSMLLVCCQLLLKEANIQTQELKLTHT